MATPQPPHDVADRPQPLPAPDRAPQSPRDPQQIGKLMADFIAAAVYGTR